MNRLPAYPSSLRTKLAGVLVAFTLPLFAAAWYAVEQAGSAAAAAERDRLASAARTYSEQLRLRLEAAKRLLLLAGRNPRLFENRDAGCALLAGLAAPGDVADELYILAPDGHFLCGADDDVADVADDPSFPIASRVAGVAIGSATPAPPSGERLLRTYYPVRHSDGRILAVLATSIVIGDLDAGFAGAAFSTQSRLAVISETGRVLASTGAAGEWLGTPGAPDALSARFFREPAGGIMETATAAGGTLIVAHAPALQYGPTRVVVAAAEAREHIVESVSARYRRLAALALGLTAAFIILIVAVADRLVTRPIARLSASVRRLGAGDLATRSGLATTSGEVGELARAFDAMAESLIAMDDTIRANRALKALVAGQRIAESTVAGAAVFQGICDRLVTDGGYLAAWIALPDADGQLAPLVAAGIALDEVRRVRGDRAHPAPQAASVAGDIDAAPDFATWRPLARTVGARSALIVPFDATASQRGTLTVWDGMPGGFRPTEQRLIEELAREVARHCALHAARGALQERLKEIHCLYRVFEATEDDERPLADMLTDVVALLPPAFLHADRAVAHLRYGDGDYRTGGHEATAATLTQTFTAGGLDGRLTIAYPATLASNGDAAFLPEEKALLDAVTSRLRGCIERRALRVGMREREALHSAIVEQARESVAVIDPLTGRFIEFNHAAHANLGYTRDGFTRLTVPDVNATPGLEAFRQRIAPLLAPGGAVLETIHRTATGELRHVRISGRPLDYHGRACLAAIWTDVTELMRARAESQRAYRELRAIADATQAIVYADDEQALLEAVCRSVVDSGGYVMAWVGLAEQDAERSVRPIAHNGAGEDYLRSVRVSWGSEPHGWGPTGRAIRENRPVAARFIDTDRAFEPWRNAAQKAGYKSSVALPLRMDLKAPHAAAALMIYAAAPDAFSNDEIVHLQGMAEALSFGIRALRDRAAKEAAQRAAKSAAARLAHLLESSPAIVYALRRDQDDWHPVEVSENITRGLGYSPVEVLTSGWWWERVHPEDRDATTASMARLIAAGRGTHVYRFRHRDGRFLWIRDEFRVVYGADGEASEVVGAWTDVTEQLQNEEERRKLTLAVEQSPESIVITDLEGRIEYVNEAFTRNSGYSRHEVIGRNPRVLQSGKTPHARHLEMWAALTRGEPWRGQFTNRRKDGTEYIESALVAPVRQPDGRVTHYLAVKEDITEHERLAQELERHRHHLEELVITRTAELVEAREKAEAANVAKSTFLANMSHEIRTPLNAITGLTHLLQTTMLSNEQRDRLAKIDASARHLLAIINDILDLSKVEAGKLALERVAFDLRNVVREGYETGTFGAAPKGLATTLELADDLPGSVVGDPLRLKQILLNLCSNAVKFTAAGAVRVRGTVVARAADHVTVRFAVEDTGPGLSEAQQTTLFQPFEQGDNSTTRRFGGTGLGLAISRRLVHAMGGEIGVESTASAGSTFWFTVPLERSDARLDAHPHAALLGGCRDPDDVTLLVVEDDAISREVAVDLLRAVNYRVDAVTDGMEAVERARETRYDLILMDVHMPRMDGLEATRRLRRGGRNLSTPVIALTASVLGDDRTECRAAGMQDFVAKPIDPERLLATVARWTATTQCAPATEAIDGDSPLARALAAIPGVHVAAGLDRAQGRWATYLDHLGLFIDVRGKDFEALTLAASRQDDHTVGVIAHALRGAAGAVGLVAIENAASMLDEALRRPQETRLPVDEALQGLAAAWAACVPALTQALAAHSPPRVAPPPIDDAAAARRLEELIALLARDDVRARAVFQDDRELFTAVLGSAATAVGRALDAYEFETAAALVQTATIGRTAAR